MLKPHLSIIIGIVLLISLAYFNSLQNPFIWDDQALIENNPYIKDFSHIKEIFTQHLFYGSRTPSNFYRPLQSLSLVFDYSIWKMNPFGYHLTNILFHALTTISIYVLIYLLSQSIFISLAASGLFAVHPVHTQAVTYIAGRSDPMASFFIYISFILYILFRKRVENKKYLTFSVIFFILSLLSREIVVVFPFVFLLYEVIYIERKKRKPGFLFYHFSVAAVYVLLRLTLLNFKTAEVTTTSYLPLGSRVVTMCKVLFLYIKLLFVPLGLHMEKYVKPIHSIGDIYGFFSVLGIFAVFYFMFWLYKWNKKLLFFSFSYFFITLIPVSNIFPLNALMAEHWLYIPSSLGFFMIMAVFLQRLLKFKYARYVVAAILIFSISWYSFLTFKRNQDWSDPVKFYRETLKYAPKSSKAHLQLGTELAKRRLYSEAREEYSRVSQLKPDDAQSHTNLGSIYGNKGRYDDAFEEFQKALELDPNDYVTHNNIGIIYKKKGDFKKAEEQYRKAIDINPNYALSYNNLGNIYLETGKYDEAIIYYKKAIELSPHTASFYGNMAKAYKNKDMIKEAQDYFEKTIELDSNNADALEELRLIRLLPTDLQ